MCVSGQLERLNPQYCIYGETLGEALDTLRDIITSKGSVSLAEYRDTIGTSRKYAVMILEHADGINMTRMEGDVRVLCR